MLERRIEQLESDNRELEGTLEQLLARHGMCEAEINHAVRAREGMMKKYRHLVKVAAELLQVCVIILTARSAGAVFRSVARTLTIDMAGL